MIAFKILKMHNKGIDLHPDAPHMHKAASMKVSSLTERISDKIIGMIDGGMLSPGAHLSVPKLAENFDVSRSPVREAFIVSGI